MINVVASSAAVLRCLGASLLGDAMCSVAESFNFLSASFLYVVLVSIAAICTPDLRFLGASLTVGDSSRVWSDLRWMRLW